MMVVTIPVLVAFVISVPPVIVLEPAAVPFPISREKLLPIVMRTDPSSARIGRPGPVSFMPAIVASHRIPVAFDPYKFRSRAWGQRVINPGRRWRSDSDAQ